MLYLLLFFIKALADFNPYGWNSVADPRAIIATKHARFTVLQDGLVRMEYSDKESLFEDRPSTVIVNRKTDLPNFSSHVKDGIVYIETSNLTLTYDSSSGMFSNENLKISYKSEASSYEWNPGMVNEGILPGTIRTLDRLRRITLNCSEITNVKPEGESLHCEYGILSRSGWYLHDDTDKAMYTLDYKWLDISGGINVPNKNKQDWYFFAYGTQYRRAISDFVSVAGSIPLVPRYMLGVLFSRWYAFDQASVKEFVQNWQSKEVPLDVFILDMNWHLSTSDHNPNQPWGAFSWNTKIYPFPQDMQEFLHGIGLRTAANIHDSNGVAPYEPFFLDFASNLSYWDETSKTIPFNSTSFEYMTKVEDILLNRIEQRQDRAGFDFWWIDWQQGDQVDVNTTTNPTALTARVRVTDHARRDENVRGVTLSRWGGLGEHRHQVGFSGDVVLGSQKTDDPWKALSYEVYFTASAANVLYGYWSHDIVGPNGNFGPVTPDAFHPASNFQNEVETRFIQWGAYSPIFRMHDRGMGQGKCMENPNLLCSPIDLTRHPWQNFNIEREVVQERARLVPYLYTQALHATMTGVSILYPLYYDHPTADDAYKYLNQYMFGESMMVAPVVNASSQKTMITDFPVWLPPGEWYEDLSGLTLTGPQLLQRSFDISEIPVYYKSGSAVPTRRVTTFTHGMAQEPFAAIEWRVYMGSKQRTIGVLYEDDGYTEDWRTKQRYSILTLEVVLDESRASMNATITNFSQRFSVDARHSTVFFDITTPVLFVSCNNVELRFSRFPGTEDSWTYDGTKLALHVPCAHNLYVAFVSPNTPSTTGTVAAVRRAKLIAEVMDSVGHFAQVAANLIGVATLNERLNHYLKYDPESIRDILANVTEMWGNAPAEVALARLEPLRGNYTSALWSTTPGMS